MTKSILKISTTFAALAVLGACSTISNPVAAPTQNLLNLGTTSTEQAASNLPFAGEERNIAPEGDSLTINFSSANLAINGDAPGTAGTVAADVLTIDMGEPGEDGAVATGTLGGRAFTVRRTGDSFADLLATFDDNGDVIVVDDPYLASMLSSPQGLFGLASRPVVLPLATRGDIQSRDPRTSVSYTIAGLQTNPEYLEGITTGGARYVGGLRATGNTFDVATGEGRSTGSDVSGFINLTANFETDRIGGSLFVSNISRRGFDLQLQETDIVGNGFATTANTVFGCPEGMVCTSDTEVGGAFYGEEADTVAGLVTFDLSATDAETGAGEQLVGVGGYVAGDGPGGPIGGPVPIFLGDG